MTNQTAKLALMRALQTVDMEDIDGSLEKLSVEAANLFPMISDEGQTDGNVGGGAAYRAKMLAESIYKVHNEAGYPGLSLEQDILINPEGMIVDGRNRIAAILKTYGKPVVDYEGDDEAVRDRFDEITTKKVDAMELLKQTAGDEEHKPEWTEADLIFKHLSVHDFKDGGFDAIMKRNMARRDMTTSQRACVAALVSGASGKRFGLGAKPTDASIADAFGIGHKTMKRAKALRKNHRDLFEAVRMGRMSVAKAELEAQKRAGNSVSAQETGKTAKTKQGVAETRTVTVADCAGIREGIMSEANEAGDLFDAIIDGLTARFSDADAAQVTKMQDALAAILGVELS